MLNKIIILLLFCLSLKGQIWITVSDSITNKPIHDVVISSEKFSALTDENGKFNLSLFGESDSLSFSHLNYLSKEKSFIELTNTKIIKLVQKTFIEDEIIISGKNNSLLKKEIINLDEETKLINNNPVDVLESSSSIFVKDYGGRGALKTVSARGLSSENTIILFNEAKVNDISTGGFDFSKLSSVSIDKIEYLKSSSEDLTSAGGIVSLFSGNYDRTNAKSLGIKYGSENYQSLFASINHTLSQFSFQLKGERSYSSNNFLYNFDGKELTRHNAQFNKSFVSLNVNYLGKENVIRFYFHYSYVNNGIPGYVVTNNYNSSNAVNRSESFLPIINYTKTLSDNFYFESSLHTQIQSLVLFDDQRAINFGNDTKDSKLIDAGFSSKLSYVKNDFTTSVQYRFEYGEITNKYFLSNSLNSYDFSKRRTISVILNSEKRFNIGNTIKEISVGGQISSNYAEENLLTKEKIYYQNFGLNTSLVPTFNENLALNISYIDTRRIPTFNERYYSSLFDNTKLRNEKYKSLDIGLGYFTKNLEAKVNLYKIWGNDRIIWVPTRLALQTPKNIGKVETSGIEFSYKQNFFDNLISLNTIYTYTEALNKSDSPNSNTFNKQIIYIPKHKFRSGLELSFYRFNLRTDFTFTGESFFTSDNSPFNKLEPYFLLDQSVTYNLSLFGYKSILSFTVYNLFNEEYLIVQSYPMPLRSFNFGFQINFN